MVAVDFLLQSQVSERYRWIYLQGFDIRQHTAPLKHDWSRSHISAIHHHNCLPHRYYIFCLNYPAILYSIAIASYMVVRNVKNQASNLNSLLLWRVTCAKPLLEPRWDSKCSSYTGWENRFCNLCNSFLNSWSSCTPEEAFWNLLIIQVDSNINTY